MSYSEAAAFAQVNESTIARRRDEPWVEQVKGIVQAAVATRVAAQVEVTRANIAEKYEKLLSKTYSARERALGATKMIPVGLGEWVEAPDHLVQLKAAEGVEDRVVGKPLQRNALEGSTAVHHIYHLPVAILEKFEQLVAPKELSAGPILDGELVDSGAPSGPGFEDVADHQGGLP